MKIKGAGTRPPRIEMLPLIDIVFLLLVVFIYTMLSMAVHKSIIVALPASSQARPSKAQNDTVIITIKDDGSVFADQRLVDPLQLASLLESRARDNPRTGVLLFADRLLPYQSLFKVMDTIRKAGIARVQLQAQSESAP